MIVTIRDQEVNLKVTSHVLESDQARPDMFNVFHCWRCGKPIMQFSGDCIMSVPGGVFSPLPIVMLCRVCKQKHLFNSIL